MYIYMFLYIRAKTAYLGSQNSAPVGGLPAKRWLVVSRKRLTLVLLVYILSVVQYTRAWSALGVLGRASGSALMAGMTVPTSDDV